MASVPVVPTYNFLRWRWHAIILSSIVILAGLFVIATKGFVMGVEFAGGTVVVAQFEQAPTVQQIREALGAQFGQVVVQQYGDPAQRQVMVRVPEVGEEQGASLSLKAQQVEKALREGNLGKVTITMTEIVGPAVGQELRSKGLQATVLSLGAILLYITFRYQFSFAVGAVVATIHDLLVTMAFLAFFQHYVGFGYDITLNVIAGILTVAGYSSNDTIVIFDRVRENLRSMRRDSLDHVINVAVNQTLSRTIITGGLTLLSALALYFFGGEVLRGFSFTLVVGVITGTYSTVFIAGAIVTFWRGKGPAKAAAHAPAPAVAQQPPRKEPPRKEPPRKASSRKARAS
jgi:preprotein translocase subunit SecF